MSAETVAPPILHHGDRLNREEFEQRFDATPELKKAELIEGVVYMSPPLSDDFHAAPHADLMGWLGWYRAHTPGVLAGDNGSVRLDGRNMPQPDASLRILHEYGGQSRNEDGYVAGAPEWVGEVSASSARLDLGVKRRVYQRFGVREYVVWRTEEQLLDWFILRDGDYENLPPGEDGIYRSEVFPGLWLDAQALFDRDLRQVLEVLQKGLASPEHAAFVQRLQAR